MKLEHNLYKGIIKIICFLSLITILSAQGQEAESAKTTKADNKGVMVQFNWVGHNLMRHAFCQEDLWECALHILFQSKFDKESIIKFGEISLSTYWVAKEIYSDEIPFWIWVFWNNGDEFLLDREGKSLCYNPSVYGCLIPYVDTFELDKPILQSASKDSKILRKTSKDDVIFALAYTSDKRFYQVIVFPNAKGITDATSIAEARNFITTAHNAKDAPYPDYMLNGFIEAKYLSNALKHHYILTKLDPEYRDERIFDRRPKE